MTELLEGYKADFEVRNENIFRYLGIDAPFELIEEGEWLKVKSPMYWSVVKLADKGIEGNISVNYLNRTYDYVYSN